MLRSEVVEVGSSPPPESPHVHVSMRTNALHESSPTLAARATRRSAPRSSPLFLQDSDDSSFDPHVYLPVTERVGAPREMAPPSSVSRETVPQTQNPQGQGRPRARARETAEQRAAKKAARLEELARKQSWREANRVRHRKSDTMQDIIVHMDAQLVERGGALHSIAEALRAKLEDGSARIEMHSRPLSVLLASDDTLGSMSFERKVRARYDPVQKLWEPLSEERTVKEPVVVMVITPEQLIQTISDQSLYTRIQNTCRPVATGMEGTEPLRPLLVVIGLDAFFYKQRISQNRAYAQAIRQRMQQSEQGGPPASQTPLAFSQKEDRRLQDDVNRALLDLQLRHRCHIIRIPVPNDAVDGLFSIVCDVSIRPYRALQNENASSAPNRSRATGKSANTMYELMLEQIV